MSVRVISESENVNEQLLEALEDEVAVVVPRLDERANVPIGVVTERFLRAILDRVPLDRIEELHLFSPLKQGTIETGIAVVAARVIIPEAEQADAPLELNFAAAVHADPAVMAAVAVEAADEVAEILEHERDENAENSVEIERDEAEAGAGDAVSEEDDGDSAEDAHADAAEIEATADVVVVDAESERDADDDFPYADEPSAAADAEEVDPDFTAAVSEFDSSEVEMTLTAADVLEAAPEIEVPRVRHTVYTARYRLIIKGPERGKWEIEVVDEADAPLLTVETVVRGVQRRSGEETETIRYDASQIARALRLPAPV